MAKCMPEVDKIILFYILYLDRSIHASRRDISLNRRSNHKIESNQKIMFELVVWPQSVLMIYEHCIKV